MKAYTHLILPSRFVLCIFIFRVYNPNCWMAKMYVDASYENKEFYANDIEYLVAIFARNCGRVLFIW